MTIRVRAHRRRGTKGVVTHIRKMTPKKPKLFSGGTVKLTIFKQKWKLGEYINNVNFPDNFNIYEREFEGSFKTYVDMANWLDQHPEYADKVMMLRTSREIGLSRMVHFTGHSTWVERYGNV